MDRTASHSTADSVTPEASRTERVGLETATYSIRGTITLPLQGYRARFSDYLHRDDIDYISLTDAERVPLEGGVPMRHAFLAVARNAVGFGYPLEDENSCDPEPPNFTR